MLRVNNLSKKYVSKKGNECNALQGVSFDLPEKGLYFILGKSGCGKSTLLNLLGGLDSCTDGEIIFNGLNISKMNSAELDAYRNEYLGFIFQEFNLIENMSVIENVSLPLSLQDIKSFERQVEKALEEVGLGGTEARFPDELSGGQKQRIAIARALIKNPQIILADEPTGNLDSETGKDIFELLVKLSKSKLIIVVSHDAESAEKYGDGIIELKDGKIIKNTCAPSEEEEKEATDLKKYRSKLPTRLALRMGFSNLLKKKVRSISCVLIAILTILSIAVSQMVLSYTPEYSIYNQVKENGNKRIILQQGEETFWGLAPDSGYIPQSTMARIKDKWGAKFVKQYPTVSDIEVENAEELLNAGFEFVGEYLPLNERNSIYISEGYVQELLSKPDNEKCYIYEDGDFVKIDKEKHNKYNLTGKSICFYPSGPNLLYSYYIAGVVLDAETKLSPDNKELRKSERTWNEAANGKVFAKQGSSDRIRGYSFILDFDASSGHLKAGARVYGDYSYDDFGNYTRDVGSIFTENGVSETALKLAENEVIISYDIYRKLFPDANSVSHYLVGNAPEHINEIISLAVKEVNDYECIRLDNMILKGVSFQASDALESPNNVVIHQNTLNKVYYKSVGCEKLIVGLASVKDLHGFLKDLRTQSVSVYVVNSNFFYGFEETANQFGLVFIVLSCIMSLILLLFVINLISVSILNQRKEIGILRALGARSSDVFKIYIFQSLLIGAVACVVSFGLSFLMAWVFNTSFTSGYMLFLNLLFVNWLTVLIIFTASFVIMGIATVIPLRKIVKMRPIDAIKNL